MPRSFLVKSQGYRDKEKKRGLGIAKLGKYDNVFALCISATCTNNLLRYDFELDVVLILPATL